MRKYFVTVALTALAACATGSAIVPPIAILAPSSGDATVDGLLALNALCSAEASGLGEPKPDLKLTSGMGTGGFKATPGGGWASFKDWPHVQLRPDASPLKTMSLAQVDAEMKQRFGS